ncbi:gustatory receptor for bitter taste 22e [Drosophila mojavensis]|uniref:gustatory receptor for bitter taste 22e n=1 Tax=Drosophila mojavensis TaxID=7230 RepID=UPI001CD181DB|nr:gustatory receptor for bitter taste 22e [Drosophila mojavensis]
MWQARRTWRHKFARFNQWATLYSSWALGLFPFVYVASSKRLRRSKWLIAYGIIVNLGIIRVSFRYYDDTEVVDLAEIYQRNPLSEQISQIQTGLNLTTLFVTLFRSWWLSEELGNVLNALLQLYETEYKSLDCTNFDNNVIYKSLTIWLELISMLFLTLGFNTPIGYKLFLGLAATMTNQLSILLLGMHFHLAVLYIYRSIWLINRELRMLATQPKIKFRRIHDLQGIYSRLVALSTRLASIYSYQMILFMLCLLSINITSIFYILVYSISLKKTLTLPLVLNLSQALAINVLDFWLHIAVCELTERAAEETSINLRLFNDRSTADSWLDRSITNFALFCTHRRPRFNYCGLFRVNNAMGFRMIVTCVLYILYLVQFDFMNL